MAAIKVKAILLQIVTEWRYEECESEMKRVKSNLSVLLPKVENPSS